jgi:hypothetical protein
MSCATHATPVFGCSGCIDARKRGEWESAPVRKVTAWYAAPWSTTDYRVVAELRVPDGATADMVASQPTLRAALLDALRKVLRDGVGSDDSIGATWLVAIKLGPLVEQAPEPAVDESQPSLFGGDS